MPIVRPPSKAKRINQLVGNRTGKVAHINRATTPDAISARRVRANTGAGRAAISNLVLHGGGKISASARNKHLTFTGGSGSGGAGRAAFDTVFNDLSRQLQNYNKQVLDENATKTAYAANVLDQQVDPVDPKNSYVDDEGVRHNLQLTPSLDEQYLGGNLQKYVVTPATAVGSVIPNTLMAGLKASYDAEDAGAGYWEQTLEGIKGSAGGWNDTIEAAVKPYENLVTGKAGDPIEQTEFHGGGDIYELAKDRGDNIFADAARWTEKNHPFIEEQFSRGAGAVMDWNMHPIGRMFGLTKSARVGGVTASPEAMRTYANEFAKRWAADAESQIITGAQHGPAGYRPYMSEAAMADHVYNELSDAFETAQLQINGGGSKGRFEVLDRNLTADVVGATGSQTLLNSMTSFYSDRVQKLVDGLEGRGTKLNGPALDHWAVGNPDFTEFLDDLTADLINKGELPTNASRNQLAAHLTAGDVKLIRNVEHSIVDRRYTPYVTQASKDMIREFKNHYYSTPGIRVGNKVIAVKGVGKAYATVNDKVFGNVGKNFRYNSQFPGSLALDTTHVRAYGVRASEDFEKQVREIAKPFSRAEGIAIGEAIQDGTIHLLPPEQQVAANWVVTQTRQMHAEEFLGGARGRKRGSAPGVDSSTTPYDPNYVYVYNKGGTELDRTEFKVNRKKTIHKNVRDKNGQGAGRFKVANAKEKGLRPSENVFETLVKRRIKYNRDMIRAKFRTDMLDKYGIIARINPSGRGFAAEERGLTKIDFHNLPESMRIVVEKTGEDYYLPRSMAEMVNRFDEITRWHPGKEGAIQRSFASVMRMFKKGQTLYWPGFHNKNMIGDVFMGLLDHILPHDYALVFAKGAQAVAGKTAVFKILKKHPGLDIPFKKMWEKFQAEANSGFSSSELGTLEGSVAKYNIPRKIGGKVEGAALKVSGWREDAGRFTHYVTAYKEEAQALWNKGMRDIDKINDQASSAALWRVNNYKFDYNALNLWEKKAKTLYFPFYTFMRKAAPTLFQAMWQDPRWISSWTRYMHQHQLPDGQESASSFDGFRIPSDIRDAGYAFIGGTQEKPQYVSNDILPTSVFNSIRTSSAHDFFNSVVTQAAVPFQIAGEQASGQQFFQDRPLKDQNFGEYLLDKVPGVREVKAWTDSDKSFGENLLTNRIGAGLPIKSLGENQQLYALQEWQDKMIDDPLRALNTEQDLYYISKQTAPDGKAQVFTVKNNNLLDSQGNATDVASYYNVQDAIGYVKKNLPDAYKKIPTTWDLDNQGKPVKREVGN